MGVGGAGAPVATAIGAGDRDTLAVSSPGAALVAGDTSGRTALGVAAAPSREGVGGKGGGGVLGGATGSAGGGGPGSGVTMVGRSPAGRAPS